MDEIEVPSYFLCPISLDLMKDPVTIPTGITYDRDSIEQWLSSSSSCPVTKQHVPPNSEPTPNHTLRRLIQAWCVINASKGVQRIPTPKPPVTRAEVSRLIQVSARSAEAKLDCLKRLKSIASHSNANKRTVESAGAVEFLASVVNCETGSNGQAVDEALTVLYNLGISEAKLKNLVNPEFVGSLTRVLRTGSYESRAYAIMLLSKMVEVVEPSSLAAQVSMSQLFIEVVQILRDRVSPRAVKAALKILIHLGPLTRNRARAVDAGAVPVLIDLLLEQSQSSESAKVSEMALIVVDILCRGAEGRAELLGHAAGLAVVSKKILRVSQAASERAVRILHSVSSFSATPRVLEEMLQVGVVAKLCLVLQVECSSKTKEWAVQILRSNARTWKNSPCVPPSLLRSYPS